MRLPQTLPLTLLFLSCLEGAPGKKGKENHEKAKPSSPWAQTGQFSTRDKHLCSWQLIPGEEVTEIHLSCHQLGEDSGRGQQCIYRGQPELCAAYRSKGRQFWKQILGKLRRKHHPCQDSSPLKSRLCSSKKGASEAELHLVPPTLTTAAPVAESTAKGKAKGKAHAKDLPAPQKPPQAPRTRVPTSSSKADAPDKRSKGGKKKVTPSSSVAPTHLSSGRPMAVVESTEQPTELNADVAAAYCEEKWHSLCNFFVNFWNG
ncbi:fibroblast growth factor-binding protein 3 [Heteronotia binoei]|uniref:fibroblast growth factor-binding protein 3 n=1 Tax=Heteronotia binoei TaxID=13085 RepID=UPI002930AFE1|nr:fibroblast growth factor-binding protein 3 [Heteronotia binoei]